MPRSKVKLVTRMLKAIHAKEGKKLLAKKQKLWWRNCDP